MGNGSRGSPKCVHLFTNSNRYLFNVGEGTQRLVIEHKCKLSKLSGIFITHSSWENVGGLPGVTLCLKDIGINKILLHGPPKVENLFIMTKCFMQTEQMDIEKYDYTKRYDDGCLIMEYIAINKEKINLPLNKSSPLHSSNLISDSVSSDEGDSSGSEGYFLKSQESVSKNNEINLNGIKSKKQDGRDINIAYIGELHSKPGALDYQKCMEHKVPPSSRLLGDLKAGQDVVLEDGTVVRSQDVVGPSEPGYRFLVVECPSNEYLGNLVRHPAFEPYHQSAVANEDERGENLPKIIRLIVHFTPPEILETSLYRDWMSKFGPSTSHLIVNATNTGDLSYIDTLDFQAKLNLLDGDIFPLGVLSRSPTSLPLPPRTQMDPRGKEEEVKGEESIVDRTYNGRTLSRYTMRPLDRCGFDSHEVRTFVGVTYSHLNIANPYLKIRGGDADELPNLGKDVTDDPNVTKPRKRTEPLAIVSLTSPEVNIAFDGAREVLRESLRGLESRLEPEPRYPQFVFLGTGSAVPNKTRNVSAIWVTLDPQTSVLMDCGEGTFGQIARFFGLLEPPRRTTTPCVPESSRTPGSGTNQLITDSALYPFDDKVVDRMLLTLKCVFVSHLHADHHLGLIQIINERRLALERREDNGQPTNVDEAHTLPHRKMLVVAPRGLLSFLRPFSNKHQDILSDIEFLQSQRLNPETYDTQALQTVQSYLNVQEFLAVPVYHFKNPTALVMKMRDGKKLVYSGDTLPCQNLIKYGQGADLLIHEATMEDDLETEGFKKRHSTISQALDMGKKMAAKFTILTHFSQRYSKIPLMNENHEAFTTLKNAGIAFDNMKVDFGNMHFLPYFIPTLKSLFSEETIEMEERTTRLIHRKRMTWE